MAHPQLLFEGAVDAFEHNFTDGHLNVIEKIQSSTVVLAQNGNVRVNGYNGVFIRGNLNDVVISDGSIQVNGMDINLGTRPSSNTAYRRASLLLPKEHPASHSIDSKSGNVELGNLTASLIRVATMSGDIALRGSEIETIALKTMSGDIIVEDTKSPNSVSAETMSGDIGIADSESTLWRLSTMSGVLE